MVASEAAPWAKTGGLADVVGALPGALARLGHEITTVLPRYRGVELANADVTTRTIRFGGISHDVAFHVVHPAPNCRAVFVDVPALFDRDGFYSHQGQDFEDNAERFAVLAVAALEFANADTTSRPIDVVHAHDWQAGLVPAFIRTDPVRYARFAAAGSVFTVHNLAYQGVFARDVVPEFGLPWEAFTLDTGEFWGQFSYLKAGITYSDYITTVSPSYARETQRPEFGCGMEGVLEARARTLRRHSERHRHRRVESGERPAASRAFRDRQPGRQACSASSACSSDSDSRAATTRWRGRSWDWCPGSWIRKASTSSSRRASSSPRSTRRGCSWDWGNRGSRSF